ncbi:MAG: OsmC family protein [Bacteroidota bacterium]|nr:OsmC family protein [Bacteroidota bacterium]MDP4289716.1 OsmC family protein [Bacteroidota bacterium]
MEDKPKTRQTLNTTIKLVNDKIHFIGKSKDNAPISIDYSSPIGDDLGYTSLELFLLSLSSCLGSSMALLLRKMNYTVSGLEIQALGIRREQHPTSFEKITLEIKLFSSDATPPAVDKALALSEESICPVWAMIRNTVEVVPIYTIMKTEDLVKVNQENR